MHKTVIVYHYLALYRKPIFRELMKSTDVEFTIYSGTESEIEIKKIDPSLAELPISEGGIRWYFLNNKWLFKKKFLWQSGLLKLVFKSSFDSFIFLGSPYHISTWLAVVILRMRRKKVYYWMHGVNKEIPSIIDWLKLKVFYKMATGFFLYGKRALSVLKKYNIKPDDNMFVIYNSLDYNESLKRRIFFDTAEVYAYRNKYFGDSATPVIIFIGRLNNIKRIDMVIEAQYIQFKKYGKVLFNILLIGDGDEKDALEQLGVAYKLDKNIVFLGAIYDEEINSKALMYADLCVTPGEVGLTAIHSMSYGTPVISHNNFNIQMPEVEAIETGITGDFYKYNDVENLSEVILNWILDNPIKTTSTMKNCFAVIDNYYNPTNQRKILENILTK